MRKQQALTEHYFERLGQYVSVFLNYIEARRKRKSIRAIYLDGGEFSAHIRKDIGLDHEIKIRNIR